MKKLKTTALALGLFTLLAGTTIVRAQNYDDGYQDQDTYNNGNVSLQNFYDELSPYGTWIQDPQYGYVWRPDVDQNEFRPYYTEGRWVMTEYGNTWVSNYDWGWAPFHYGRWVYNQYRQWIWLPDTNWGPAWVNWRSGGGYYGWAPMGPSININISFGRRYSLPTYCWNFIPQRSIYSNYYPRYNYGRNNVYIRNTTIINNTYVYNRRSYYGGPSRSEISRATNRDVAVYRVNRSDRPGASVVDRSSVNIYQPRPERGATNRAVAPKDYQRGSIAGVNNATSGRPERNGTTPNSSINRSNADANRNTSSENTTRAPQATSNNRPQRGVYNNNSTKPIERNATERNPNQQEGVSAPANRTSTRPTRNVDVSSQPANAAIQQQRTQEPQVTDQRAQAEQQRVQRGKQEQAVAAQRQEQEKQRAQQAEQQRTQRAQQEQAAQQKAQQRVQQEQAQRQEQSRQQQQRTQRQEAPQRVERSQPASRQEAPKRVETNRESGRPTRGGK